MTKQFLKASPQGIQTIKQALKWKKWSQTDLAGQVFCARQTIGSLLKGELKDSALFKNVCEQLGLNWEEIAERESVEPETITPSNIDNLVQEMRDRIRLLIEQACGTMRVLDMSYPIGLDGIYTDVNILERITSRRGLKLAEMMQEAGQEHFERFCLGDVREERVPALVAVERFSKLMILGKPGAGKTTFLKRLAMQCIGGRFKADHVPVFVTLKDFAEADGQPSLVKYLDCWAGGPLGAIVRAGRAMILLDGLDEVREVDSDRVLRQIKTFSQQFAQNCLVVTCRIAAREYTFEQFTEVEVADFDGKQIAEFSNNWFRSRNDAVKAKRFLEKLEKDKPIRELATSPLLLTLLCSVFEDSGSFPTNRAELYQNGVNVLLRKWDVKRNIERSQVYKDLSLKRKEALLGQIARKTFEAGNYFFKQREAERHISEYIQNLPGASTDPEALEVDSTAVLKSIEAHHGLLVERARGIYSFSHLTFHEYFTAQEFATNSDPKMLEQKLQMLTSYITDERWREVFLLTTEKILPSADYLLQTMKFYIDRLIAEDQKLQQFLVWVKQKSESIKCPYKLAAIRSFYFYYGSEIGFGLSQSPNRSINPLPTADELVRSLDKNFEKANFNEDLLNYGLALDTVCTFANGAVNEVDTAFLFIEIIFNCLTNVKEVAISKKLQELRQKLPVLDSDRIAKIDLIELQIEWWKTEGEVWARQLRAAMTEHRNIGIDWEFRGEQKQRLVQYYNANELLVRCLNSDCEVSREVRQEIEETLLLPIAEIEKQNKAKGKL